MGFRITTNMSMNTYRYNLQGSTKKLSDARDKVLTQRNFNSYAEDPTAATLAFRLRRDYYKTNNYLNNTQDVYSKFNTAYHNLGGVITELSDATARMASITGNNPPAGESRKSLAVVLRETSESVIHAMNQQLGDQFVFAGNDGLNVPFSWNGETLMYRGIDVNSDSAKLDEMAKEEMYIDLGLGAEESTPNNAVKGSYFNNALSGVDYLGYGRDEDGDPKNLALIMRELADVFQAWDEDMKPKQGYDPDQAGPSAVDPKTGDPLTSSQLEEKAKRLMDKLKAAQEHTTEKYVELSSKSVFLRTNESRLTTQKSDLNEEILNVEQVDLAEAITSFSWEQYCYNAALKVGSQLLSQSLIDYMR